jgi:sterol desaturase/sphingolipid hydroxylase (fatty acid hydroxylase superfamily)
MQPGGSTLGDMLVANSGQILLGTVFGGIALVMLIESMAPLRPEAKAPLVRWVSNLSLTAVDYAVMFGMAPLVLFLIASTIGLEQTGLLHVLKLSLVASFIVTLLCLEFLNYWVHRAYHAVPLLWRIHAVHHSDPEMDATTSHRHHPLEPVVSTLLTVPVMVGLGADPLVLLGFNVLHTAMAVLSHGNITLGQRVDNVLRYFVVTPDFHRMHHSAERRYTDSNYTAILPLFDYLFRTATRCPAEQHKTMSLGLPYFRERRYSRLDQLLLIPFLPGFRTAAPRLADPSLPERNSRQRAG